MASKIKRPSGSLGHRILEGIHFHMLGHAAVLAVNFGLTPILIKGLGTDGYGLYTLMWTISGYLMLMNAGTTAGAQKFTAQWFHKAEETPLAKILRKVFWIQMGLGIVGGAVVWFSRGLLATHWLNIQGPVLEQAPYVFGCVALAAPAGFALHYGINLLYGMQRFGAYNFFITMQSITVAIIAAALLSVGRSLTEIALFFVVAHVLLAVLVLFWAQDVLMMRSKKKKGAEKEFMVFSGKSWFSQLMWILIFQGDRIFIGTMLPLTMMGYYAISSTLASKFNTFCGAVSSAAFPMMTELYGKGEIKRLRRFYLKAAELSFCFVLPLTILSVTLVPQFMTLWLGEDFSQISTGPFRLLVVANFAYLASFLPNCVAMSHGQPQIMTYSQMVKVVILFILWPILIPKYGILGAAMGLVTAEWIVAPAFVLYVHSRFLKISLTTFWVESCWRPMVSGAALAAFMFATHGRVSNWVELIGLGAAGSGLFAGVTYCLLDKEAKSVLSNWLGSKIGIK